MLVEINTIKRGPTCASINNKCILNPGIDYFRVSFGSFALRYIYDYHSDICYRAYSRIYNN